MFRRDFRRVGRKLVPRVTLTVDVPKRRKRAIVLRSLGLHVPGYCVPIPDTTDTITVANGDLDRMCRDSVSAVDALPAAQPEELAKFDEFMTRKLMSLEPLPLGLNMCPVNWATNLAKNYNVKRQREIIDAAMGLPYVPELAFRRTGKTFGKVERLPQMKPCRGINSPNDEIKARLAPAAYWMEKYIYENQVGWKVHFIKHIPNHDRPNYISNVVKYPCTTYGCSDYTKFECSFSSEFITACELRVYERLLLNYPQIYQHFTCLANEATMTNKRLGITLKCKGRRMSGEMVTSLGNGLGNAMLLMYMDEVYGSGLLGAVVEGDRKSVV